MSASLATISSDQQQRDLALNTHESFIVQAPAGSGKTELLTQRYLSLLGEASQPESILAMTFTNKAADELKHRVFQYLHDAELPPPKEPYKLQTFTLASKALAQSNKQGWDILSNPSRIKISTIDALSSLIVSKYPTAEQPIPPRVMADRYEYEALYQSAAENTFKLIEDKDYQDSIASVLLHLDNHVEKFCRLLLQMLAKREQWLPRLYQQGALEIEVLERTAKNIACEHMLSARTLAKYALDATFFATLEDNPMAPNKIPGADLQALDSWRALADLCLTAKGQWRKTVDKRQGFDAKLKEQKQNFIGMLQQLHLEEGLREALFEFTMLPEVSYGETDHLVLQNISQVLKLSVAQLKLAFETHNVFDFAEMGLNALDKLDELDGVADVALFLDYKIEHLLIDEFQDTSYAQFSLIKKLLSGWQTDSGKTLFLVGDPMQSIYRFRESQVGIFLEVINNGISDIRPKYLQLISNFRSIKSIVDVNNFYFSTIFPSNNNVVNGAICYENSQATSSVEDEKAVRFYPFYPNMALEEAAQVCEIVDDVLTKDADAEIAILVRSRSHLSEIIHALRLNSTEFEAVKTTPLRSHLFTRDLLSLTRAMFSLGDKLAWLSLLRTPWCGLLLEDLLILGESESMTIYHQITKAEIYAKLSGDAQERLQPMLGVMLEAITNEGRLSFVERFSCALNTLSQNACLDEEKCSIKEQFIAILYQCEQRDNLNLESVEAMLAELFAPSYSARVKLMTIHQAKGLEFDVVIIPGLGKAGKSDTLPLVQLKPFADNHLLLAPIKSAFEKNESQTYNYLKHLDKKQNHYEMMRLLYVAMSRAKKKIHLLGHVNENEEAANNTLLSFIFPFFKDSMILPSKPYIEELKADPIPQLQRYQDMPVIEGITRNMADETLSLTKNLDLIYQSALGTTLHHFLEHEIFEPDEKSVDTRLFELGVPSQLRDCYCKKILQLLENSRNDSIFDWLFKKRASTQVEAEFATLDGSIIIDRLFIDNNTLWIIDFKATTPALEEPLDVFTSRLTKQHQGQLSHYQKVLEGIFQLPTKTALYCPAVPQFICL